MDTITQMARGDWLVGGAVNGARWYRHAAGITGAVRDDVADPVFRGLVRPAEDLLPWNDVSPEPVYEEEAAPESVMGPREGFSTAQEREQLFGLKAVAMPTRGAALDAAYQKRILDAKAAEGEEKKRSPVRYGR